MTEDAKLISEFRAKFGTNIFRSTSKEYYEWKLFRNPYQKGKIYLERKDGKVIGSTTITPKRISIGGEERLAAEIGDTFTHPDHRRKGVFSRGVDACTRFAISQGITIIYGTPNSESLAGYQKKLGYPPCPFVKLKYLTKHRRILLPAGKFIGKVVLRRKSRPPNLFLLAMLKQRFSHSAFPRLNVSARQRLFDISRVHKFTDEIDGVWGSSRYLFFNIRDKTYLNWRYFSNPDKYQVLAAKRVDDYLGYAVTKLSRNRKIGTICDFMTYDDRLDVFDILIQEAEKMLVRAGVHWIQTFSVEGSPYYQALIGQGYYDHGSTSRQPVIVFSGTYCGKALLETEGKWHFTMSDSDNI